MKIYNRFNGELIIDTNNLAKIPGADLSITNLSHTDLSGANLYGAYLSRTDFSHANLSHADLYFTDLSHADLSGANLSHADLSNANLSGADLSGANLYHADLSYADLMYADLTYANFYCTDLNYADLSVKNIPIYDHWFISELLLREASTEAQKDFASRIRTQTDKCWEYFIKLALRNRVYKWAYKVLSQWPEAIEKINKERKSI